MYTIHATKKLLERVKPDVVPAADGTTTALGNWYATAIFWKPQVALFVNETTLLPVFVPLAPASTVAARFPEQLWQVLAGLDVPVEFISQELESMGVATYAKTANRSVVGTMNDFSFTAGVHRDHGQHDLVALSVELADTPCGPLRNGLGFPDLELAALVGRVLGD